jgi:hypothetical protein
MFESVSVVSLGIGAIYSLSGAGSAISPEAQTVQSAAVQIARAVESSQALFGSKATAISQLWQLANEFAEADWDGDGALPLDHAAIHNAVAFIRALPDRVPMPEFAPEPDGSISLDWIRSRTSVFSLSIGASHRLAYAWLDGTDQGHAVARFEGGNIPLRILEGIEGIVKLGNAAVRSA